MNWNHFFKENEMKQRSVRAITSPYCMGMVCVALLLVAATAAVAEEPKVTFPDPQSATQAEERFVSGENLQNIGTGLTKYQTTDLLGPPQFSEGVFGVKVWNYLLNFRRNGEVLTCQYQVQFDDRNLVRQVFWKEPVCADFLGEKAPV